MLTISQEKFTLRRLWSINKSNSAVLCLQMLLAGCCHGHGSGRASAQSKDCKVAMVVVCDAGRKKQRISSLQAKSNMWKTSWECCRKIHCVTSIRCVNDSVFSQLGLCQSPCSCEELPLPHRCRWKMAVVWQLTSLKRDPSSDSDELLGSGGVADEIGTDGDWGDRRSSMAAVVALLLACVARLLLLTLSLPGPSESSDGVGSPQHGPLVAAYRSASRIDKNESPGNGRIAGEICGANMIRPLRCGSRTSPTHDPLP
jgi:hypothetical protein